MPPSAVARAEFARSGSVGKPPTPFGCADSGVVTRSDPVTGVCVTSDGARFTGALALCAIGALDGNAVDPLGTTVALLCTVAPPLEPPFEPPPPEPPPFEPPPPEPPPPEPPPPEPMPVAPLDIAERCF